MNNKKTIINIGGCVRSGTTLLNLILANDDRALSLGEIQYIFKPNRKQHLIRIKELQSDPLWSFVIKGGQKNLYCNLIKLFPEKDFFIDSSKVPDWYKIQMKANPELNFRNIVIYKHPLDQKASLVRRQPHREWSRRVYQYYIRYFAHIEDFQSVSLYDLLNHENALVAICSHTGLPYFKTKNEYWTRSHPNFFGSDTVRKSKLDPSNLRPLENLNLLKDELPDPYGKLFKIYKFLVNRDIRKDIEDFESFPMTSYEKILLDLRSVLSDKLTRTKLWYRDFVKDRRWLIDEK